MINKAINSREIADSFYEEEQYMDFCANRYYYSLYQMADAYALKCLNRNIWEELEEKKRRRKLENSKVYIPSSHVEMEGVVRDFTGSSNKELLINFKNLKALRHTADYYRIPVKKYQLKAHKTKALKLFDMLKAAINQKEAEDE